MQIRYKMKHSLTYIGVIFLAFYFSTTNSIADDKNSADNAPQRLRRSESFFGVHFDFHAGKNVKNIGETTTPEMVQAIIDSLHPDFIQVDSKGHPGLSSYPTKVGNPAPGVVADSLKIWREVTARNGVALYTHYSGVWDSEAVALHPDWAVVNADGSLSKEKNSVFGEYKDQLLIPQLIELALNYKTDGIWVDGECWATCIDYSTKAREAFKQKTGRETIPTSPSQEGWEEWYFFHQEAFRQYLRDYVNKVKDKAPNFQVASNWAFTDHMGEPVSANVDFISGDYSPNNSINAARYSTRLLSTQNYPWDLMAWSFGSVSGNYGNWGPKTGVQLSREAACVLAQGGSFQAYITQNPDGSVNLDKLPAMAETAKFCRERQKLCQYSTIIPQVALFCPTAQYYHNNAQAGASLFAMPNWQRPMLNRILELNYSVDVRLDNNLVQTLNEIPAVVFFRGGLWSEKLKSKIVDYVNDGGTIISIGNEPLEEIRPMLKSAKEVYTENYNEIWFYHSYSYGNGKIIVIPTPVGSPDDFINATGQLFTQYLEKALTEALPKPIVQFDQKQPLDVSIRKTSNGQMSIHLVNVSGPHEQAGIIESITPVEDVKVYLNLDAKIQNIHLEPSGTPIDYTQQDNRIKLVIPSIPIYEILVIEND